LEANTSQLLEIQNKERTLQLYCAMNVGTFEVQV
jgi:hypothetical protein